VALLIDWENIKKSLQDAELKPNVTAIREVAEQYGRLVIARAYADWSDSWHHRDPRRLYDASIEPIYVPTKTSLRRGGSRRLPNSVDVKLATDCIEIIHRYPDIQTIVLVSGDADFIHAVNLVRPYGKRVVAIGVSWSTANRLIETVDEFIEYDKDIIQAQPAGRALSDKDEQELERALQLTPEIVASSRYPGRAISKWVRRELVKKLDGFDERKYGLGNFRLFLQQAEKRGLIKLVTTEGMVEWVQLPDTKTPDSEKPKTVDLSTTMIRFAHDLEQKCNFVSFNFLINRMIEASAISHTRTQLAGALSDAIDEELFIRGRYQRTDAEGENQGVRTIALDHDHPAVQAALSEDEELSTLLSALADNPDSPEQHQRVSHRYLELGQLSQALEHQDKAIKLAPDRLDLRTRKVVLLGKADQIEQAIETGRALAEANPSSPHALGALAQVYEQSGAFRTAIPYYRQALALAPKDDTDLRLSFTLPIIHCYQELGALDKARALCQEALGWAGDSPALQELNEYPFRGYPDVLQIFDIWETL